MDLRKADFTFVNNQSFWETKCYCKEIHNTKEGMKACHYSDECLFKKSRESKKIDKHFYHELYLACKANQYKSKKNLADAIEKIIYKKGLEQKTAAQKQALKEKKGKK